MDENSAIIEAILREDEEEAEKQRRRDSNDDAYAWQTVSYHKRQRKPSKAPQPDAAADLRNGRPNGSAVADVFRPIEQHSEERRRRALEAQMAADAVAESAVAGSKRHSDEEGDSDDEEASAAQNGVGGEPKKVKVKKPKKPKVTVAEAASKIDAADLGAFLADVTVSHRLLQFYANFYLFIFLVIFFAIDLLVYY